MLGERFTARTVGEDEMVSEGEESVSIALGTFPFFFWTWSEEETVNEGTLKGLENTDTFLDFEFLGNDECSPVDNIEVAPKPSFLFEPFAYLGYINKPVLSDTPECLAKEGCLACSSTVEGETLGLTALLDCRKIEEEALDPLSSFERRDVPK